MKKKLFFPLLIFLPFFLPGQETGQPPHRMVTTAASRRYDDISVFRRLAMGSNYRRDWAVPVQLPVFDLRKGKWTIEKQGGGQQTKTLHLLDPQGREWILRSVDKYVEGALPPYLRETLAKRITQDMISAAHPYAALVVGDLAAALHIPAPRPAIYFVPDDPALGNYRADFGGTVCFLELEEPTRDGTEAYTTAEVVQERSEHAVGIDQVTVLRARLLDMLVADWDRHPDQWRWGRTDSAGCRYYYPIPRDRDQAFFRSGGLVPLLAKWFTLPHLDRFNRRGNKLKMLSLKSWAFDRNFLNGLDAATWQTLIREFTDQLPDPVVEAAVRKLPPEVLPLHGEEIAARLKSRRNNLLKEAMKYYRFLAASVQVTGSDENELFRITGEGNTLTLTVSQLGKTGTAGRVLYRRRFLEGETRQLVMQGLAGDDQFVVDESVKAKIRLRFYGSSGRDVYHIQGEAKSIVYDRASEQNQLKLHPQARVVLTD